MGWRWYEGRFINDQEYDDEETKKYSRTIRFISLLVCVYSFWNGHTIVGSAAAFLTLFPQVGCALLVFGFVGWILFVIVKGLFGF